MDGTKIRPVYKRLVGCSDRSKNTYPASTKTSFNSNQPNFQHTDYKCLENVAPYLGLQSEAHRLPRVLGKKIPSERASILHALLDDMMIFVTNNNFLVLLLLEQTSCPPGFEVGHYVCKLFYRGSFISNCGIYTGRRTA